MGTTPSVEGAAERRRALRRAALYTIGLVFGALSYALVLSLAFDALGAHRVALALAAAAALVFPVAAISGHRIPTFGRMWQVPRSWVTRDTLIGFVASGFVLGLGFLTPIRYPTFFVWSALLAALPPERAAPVGVIYGIARSLSNWHSALGPVKPGLEMPERLMRRNAIFTRAIDLATAASAVVIFILLSAGHAGSVVGEEHPRSERVGTHPLTVPDRSPFEVDGSGVFVTARGSGVAAPGAGLWFVPLRGRVRPLVSREWVPLVGSTSGAFAAVAAPDITGPVAILADGTATALPGTAGAACVSWSRDGSQLAYITGERQLIPRPGRMPMFGWLGTLWVVRTRPNLASAERIADGLFSAAECPVWAPDRSSLAYMVRSAAGDWSLRLWRGDVDAQIAALSDAIPSVLYRTLVWRPGGGGFAFLDGGSIWSSGGGVVRALGRRGALRPVEVRGTRGAEKWGDPAARILSFSPNGRWLAASVGAATGIFRANGRLVRIVPGHLMGWSGSIAVLTEGAAVFGFPPTLVRYGFIPGRGGKVLARSFKWAVVTDPAGHWFAYPDVHSQSIIFRRPDGRILRRVPVRFYPFTLQARSADGRLADPAGQY